MYTEITDNNSIAHATNSLGLSGSVTHNRMYTPVICKKWQCPQINRNVTCNATVIKNEPSLSTGVA